MPDIARVNTLAFIHNYFYGKLPKVFKNYFTVFKEVHAINTRGSTNNIIIDRHNSSIGHSTMKVRGAKLWNNIDVDKKKIKNVKHFRKQIKTAILPYQDN